MKHGRKKMVSNTLGYDSNDRNDGTFEDCPFCGGEADLRIYEVPFSHQHYQYTVCLNCGAMTKPDALTSREAIRRWNIRYKR